jgi:hypothetical protein
VCRNTDAVFGHAGSIWPAVVGRSGSASGGRIVAGGSVGALVAAVVCVSVWCLRDGLLTQYLVTQAAFGSRSLDVLAVLGGGAQGCWRFQGALMAGGGSCVGLVSVCRIRARRDHHVKPPAVFGHGGNISLAVVGLFRCRWGCRPEGAGGSLVVRVSGWCLRDGSLTQYLVTQAVFRSRLNAPR